MADDPTVDPGRRSWVPVAADSDFPIQNLPYGVVSYADDERRRVAVAIGDHVLDLYELAQARLLDAGPLDPETVLAVPTLNRFLALGRDAWRAVRHRVSQLLDAADRSVRDRPGLLARVLRPREQVLLHLPFAPGDYVDFYSSLEHATNLGRIFRPDSEPLPASWRYLPLGYQGRCSTVVVSGTPVVRPCGQSRPRVDGMPVFGPTRELDFELEVGFVTGAGNPMGTRIPIHQAAEHIFGMVLVNDWSARDLQVWEYQPLGPFLGKSFATSVSPWVVPMDALVPYRVPPPTQDPAPLPYLRSQHDWALDIHLEVLLTPVGGEPELLAATNFRGMYWTPAQQLAHATANGAAVRPGDLYASGTVSGSDPASYGSLIELTWRGERPLRLVGGAQRTFLQDGDTVIMRGWCGGRGGAPRVGFGEVRGTVLPARPDWP